MKTKNTKMLINVIDRENHEISFSFPVQKKKTQKELSLELWIQTKVKRPWEHYLLDCMFQWETSDSSFIGPMVGRVEYLTS